MELSKKRIIIFVFIIVVAICIVSGILLMPRMINKEDSNEEISKEKYKIVNGAIYEELESLNDSGIANNIEKINKVCEKYLKASNIYFALIPNKEYYLNNDIGTESEFKEIEGFVKSKLTGKINYIELFDTLNLECYYKTDMHWRQESLDRVLNRFSNSINLNYGDIQITNTKKYEQKSLGDFYGSYYKEINDNTIQPDKLIYLNNDMIEDCIVYNIEKDEKEKVYNLDRVNETKNKYDLFLSGASAIQRIENKEVQNGKKLILFRDSFGSSIAPLLIGSYEEILLVDIRYVNSEFLADYIDFKKYEGQDVLFLYNTRVINKSGIFR